MTSICSSSSPALASAFLTADTGPRPMIFGIDAGVPVGDQARHRFQAAFAAAATFPSTPPPRAASLIPDALPAVTLPLSFEDRSSLAMPSIVESRAHVLVGIELTGPLLALEFDRQDLALEMTLPDRAPRRASGFAPRTRPAARA